MFDPDREVWYVPFQGILPTTGGGPGRRIPQFLIAVDLERLAAGCRA